ncbi:hypothetical protein JB92DRAFT_2956662 [Gautieria morchelliformis]|nr:hypothetical protein JB92DRAFT_2956560 [Gautieria morchelliformis]KAF8507867.1 hypothetical protein JB92DRAFT_2956662 [Gautieria morchelliformis]
MRTGSDDSRRLALAKANIIDPVAELQSELGEHEDAEKIVNDHIKLLHRYNEAKDATQESFL